MSALAPVVASTRVCQWHAGCDQPSSGRRNADGLLLCKRHANTARQRRDRDRKRAAEERRVDRICIDEILAAAARELDVRGFGGHRIGWPTKAQLEHARRVDRILIGLLGGVPRPRQAVA